MTQQGSHLTARPAPVILVVDDEDIVRALTARALREAGYRVIHAQHGGAAISILERPREPIDLVISDLVMPGIGGRDLARWVATHQPELPLFFISGYPKSYLEAHDLFDPQIPLLRKPFLPSRLLETVREFLPEPPESLSSSAVEGI
jgi:two-component system, cell cycle sensor histidine kinase and response regulator CckA